MKLDKLVIYIYITMFSSILFLLIAVKDIVDVATGKRFLLETGGLIVIGILLLVIVIWMYNLRKMQINRFFSIYSNRLRIISSVILVIIQIILCYSTYFISGWDPGIIKETVLSEVTRDYSSLSHTYYSWYPNNLLLVWIFTTILRPFYNIVPFDQLEFILCIFQCVIDGVAGWLLYDIAYKISNNYLWTWGTYLIYWLFVGISPWFIVPYSDATGLLFPVLIIWLYFRLQNKSKLHRFLIAIAIGVVGNMGEHIKPQIIIVVIAIIINEILIFFRKSSFESFKVLFTLIISIIIGFLAMETVYTYLIVPQLNIELDDNLRMGIPHYLMMGLNDVTDGSYLDTDRKFSISFETVREREKENLIECKKRINEYGIKGLFKHLCKKTLVNYGDGTFAWAEEGGFFMGEPEWANTKLSSLLRALIYPEGKYYKWFISIKQLFWIMILCGMPCLFVERNRINCQKNSVIYVLAMSVIGLTLFQLAFEARARYSFCYSPFFVLLGSYGIFVFYRQLRQHNRVFML